MKLGKINKLRGLVLGQLAICEEFGVEPTHQLLAIEEITRCMKFGYRPEENIKIFDGGLLFRTVRNKIYIYDNLCKKPKKLATLVLR